MNNELKKLKSLYNTSLIAYLSAGIVFTILLVIILITSENDDTSQLLFYIPAAVFWLCMILGTVFVILAGNKERQIYRQIKASDESENYKRNILFGSISFFRNKKALIADVLFLVSVISIVVIYVAHVNVSWLIVTLTMLVITSFIFHSFWNGKIYNCINYLKNESKKKE